MLALDARTCDCVPPRRIGSVFVLSFAHQCLSNRRRPYLFIYVVATNRIPFENFSMAVSLSVRSFRLLCCKIFVLKYFRRTSTLRKFFNTKIFLTKISYNENFPIYGNTSFVTIVCCRLVLPLVLHTRNVTIQTATNS